jgi:hypothetical protein
VSALAGQIASPGDYNDDTRKIVARARRGHGRGRAEETDMATRKSKPNIVQRLSDELAQEPTKAPPPCCADAAESECPQCGQARRASRSQLYAKTVGRRAPS